MIEVRQDMHVHSRFSDGRNTIAENVEEAESLGLLELTCVDHVRVGTSWVADYAAAVHHANTSTPVALRCGVEAKLMNTQGDLDLPVDLNGVDVVYAADHQVPLDDGPHTPSEVKAQFVDGTLTADEAIGSIVLATADALGQAHLPVVIAHLFSVLPKLDLSERDVPQELLESLAESAARAGAAVEISERWRCPSARSLRPFLRAGVPILLSTDSHRRETIGRYEYCLQTLRELTGGCSPAPHAARTATGA